MDTKCFAYDGTLGFGGFLRQNQFHDAVAVEEQVCVGGGQVTVFLFNVLFTVGRVGTPDAGVLLREPIPVDGELDLTEGDGIAGVFQVVLDDRLP